MFTLNLFQKTVTFDGWVFAFSFVTVVATIAMGFWSARKSKTAGDFFVAGRSVSVGWNASAISGEYLSAASFMGIAGMVMKFGYDALWYPVCYACGYLFLLLFIAGPLRRFGAYTIPDFAEGRFDSPLFRKIAVCFVLFIGFFYTMPQMKGAGTTLAYIFQGLPYKIGVILVGAIITFNVALGGMKGITLVQAFQYWLKMFAISVPIFVLMSVYGPYNQQLKVNSTKPDAPLPNAVFQTMDPVPTLRRSDANQLLEFLKSARAHLFSRATPADPDATISAGSIVVRGMPFAQFLEIYRAFSGRTVLVLSNTPIPSSLTCVLDKDLKHREVVSHFEQVLRNEEIALVPFEDSFVIATTPEREPAVQKYIAEFGITSSYR